MNIKVQKFEGAYTEIYTKAMGCYFIEIDCFRADKDICKKINFNLYEYRKYMVEAFNAFICDMEVFYYTQEDAQKAVEWIKSAALAKKLTGNV